MFVHNCFTNDYDQDHDSKVSQSNLGILESRIWREREDLRHESFELDIGVRDAKDERVRDNQRILKQIVGYYQQEKNVGKGVSTF